ncbi:epsin [Geosmithia morbida]|uniref:Epsin n=1 Tax=Geosmithia morbida TaxID=1094350 RepID=A0A9P4YVR0_9HYPO|nr:epsin [Geosmithia morbida]KAF4122692.1 epsin [Geosmithia morbida]
MSRVMRSVRNVTKGYSSTQIKVREATSNDPWGPTGTQMSEIAQMTFNTCVSMMGHPSRDTELTPCCDYRSSDFYDIMDMIDKRLNDKGKNWRHVLKALKVLDYCLHEGSELVVTWARQSVYIIKTLREFQYVDEEGRDVGQNVRIAAKEITSLILDEERLRAERSDRKSWKSRVTGLEEFAPSNYAEPSTRRRERPQMSDEDDAEYRLALEASKFQEEEDRRKREGRGPAAEIDDDLAKAIKLSKEEDERRRRELEQSNAASLFDDTPVQTQPQPTGFNGGYEQGNQVDWFANPVDQGQMQPQPTGMMPAAYAGFQQPQMTGYPGAYQTPFGAQPTGMDPYGLQQQQAFQPQPTGYNPYAQQQLPLQTQQASLQIPSPVNGGPNPQPGSNNPWATNGQSNQPSALMPTPTGSNNPFAQHKRPSSAQPTSSGLGAVPEQKTLASFSSLQKQQQPSFANTNTTVNGNPMSEHESKLNALLASGDGMDTYGNTGNLRIPAQHTAPGTFINSAGSGVNRLNPEPTGSNPFMRQQFTGLPTVSYGGQFGGASNPYGGQQGQQQQQNQDLIQF